MHAFIDINTSPFFLLPSEKAKGRFTALNAENTADKVQLQMRMCKCSVNAGADMHRMQKWTEAAIQREKVLTFRGMSCPGFLSVFQGVPQRANLYLGTRSSWSMMTQSAAHPGSESSTSSGMVANLHKRGNGQSHLRESGSEWGCNSEVVAHLSDHRQVQSLQ